MRSLPRGRLAESAPAISAQGPEAESDAYHFAEATWAPEGRAVGEAERACMQTLCPVTETAGAAAWPRNENEADRRSTGPRAAAAARSGWTEGSTLETDQVMGSEPDAGTSRVASNEAEPFE